MSFHEMHFLRHEGAKHGLGEVITLARQNINVTRPKIDAALGSGLTSADAVYVDDLLIEAFGATSVSSVDFSTYEGATYVADMNVPFDIGRRFDTVIDFGTTEHVFDVATVLRNMIQLCAIGGRIIHASPSNSECGHGFFQFSPELYLSLYSEQNGFCDTEVFVAQVMNETDWYRVRPAAPGDRIMINSLAATYLLVSTTKVRDVPLLSVQQSDYVHAWAVGETVRGNTGVRWRDSARAALVGSRIAEIATLGYRTWMARTGLNRFNPHLERIAIRDVA
jgi:SAM-dependent methyltransferase